MEQKLKDIYGRMKDLMQELISLSDDEGTPEHISPTLDNAASFISDGQEQVNKAMKELAG